MGSGMTLRPWCLVKLEFLVPSLTRSQVDCPSWSTWESRSSRNLSKMVPWVPVSHFRTHRRRRAFATERTTMSTEFLDGVVSRGDDFVFVNFERGAGQGGCGWISGDPKSSPGPGNLVAKGPSFQVQAWDLQNRQPGKWEPRDCLERGSKEPEAPWSYHCQGVKLTG